MAWLRDFCAPSPGFAADLGFALDRRRLRLLADFCQNADMSFIGGRSTRSTPGSPGGHSVAAGSHVPALRRAFGGRPQQPRDAGAEGVDAVSMLKLRAGLLGLLAMLVVGSFAAASASAQGPFWYHRPLNGQGKGVKLSGQEPEEVRGSGGEATLEGEVTGVGAVEISASQVQVKGIIYNNDQQGQAKLEIAYAQPRLVKPSLANCNVTVGPKNVVKVFGHLAWTWNGTTEQTA